MRFLSVEGVTGKEAKIAAAVSDALKTVGVPASAIRFDDANKRIPLPTETGNLIVDLPGTRPGPRLLFSTHLDTVPLCAGAKPRREGDRIVSDGTTALGGDDRTGCARAGRACRDADQAQAAASADHPALHGARGERPAWRARAQPEGPRRRGDVHQRRRPDARRSDHRRGRPGELGGRDQRQGLACRRRAREGHLGDAGRRPRPGRGAPRRAGSARWSSRTAAAPAMSASSAARTASLPATRPTSSPTTPSSRARRAVPKSAFASEDRRGLSSRLREGARTRSRITRATRRRSKFSQPAAYPPFKLDEDAPVVQRATKALEDARHRAELPVLQRRARRQLARQARHPDGHHRRRPGRDPHDQGICEPARNSRRDAASRVLLATLED